VYRINWCILREFGRDYPFLSFSIWSERFSSSKACERLLFFFNHFILGLFFLRLPCYLLVILYRLFLGRSMLLLPISDLNLAIFRFVDRFVCMFVFMYLFHSIFRCTHSFVSSALHNVLLYFIEQCSFRDTASVFSFLSSLIRASFLMSGLVPAVHVMMHLIVALQVHDLIYCRICHFPRIVSSRHSILLAFEISNSSSFSNFHSRFMDCSFFGCLAIFCTHRFFLSPSMLH